MATSLGPNALATNAPLSTDRGAAFDIEQLNQHPLRLAITTWLLDYPTREYFASFFRAFFPVCELPGLGLVLFRDEHVREALTHDREFPVPWADRMIEITGGKNFLLGMADGPEYSRCYEQLAAAFPRTDAQKHVAPAAARITNQLLEGKSALDAVRELMWAVPAHLCESYIGLETPDKLLLADWSVAISSYIFAPNDEPSAVTKTLALTAAEGLRDLIRSSVRKTRAGRLNGPALSCLIGLQRTDRHLSDSVIEAHLFGMVTGFVPTNLLAGGNMLDTLLRRPEFMKAAQDAALDGDDDLLWRCLREALRFRHINPGIYRVCGPNGYTFSSGLRRERFVTSGTRVLASTQSAMFDSRRVQHPARFDPDRPTDHAMIFGHGQHWCLGAHIAIAQLTQTFKALLTRGPIRRAAGRAGKLKRINVFPAHLTIEIGR